MIKIIGLSGSLRLHSYNTALLRTAASLVPTDVTLTVSTINGIPLFNEDVEAQGYPASVQELKELIASADGLLLSTPEYNNSMPGVLKNAMDWLSRPGDEIPRIFGEKPFAIMGASIGGFGTILSQNAWLTPMKALGVKPWTNGRLLVARASNSFNADGLLIDAALLAQLRTFIEGFAGFIAAEKNAHAK